MKTLNLSDEDYDRLVRVLRDAVTATRVIADLTGMGDTEAYREALHLRDVFQSIAYDIDEDEDRDDDDPLVLNIGWTPPCPR